MQNPIQFKSHNQLLFVIAIVFLFLIFWNIAVVDFCFAVNVFPTSKVFLTAVFLSMLSCYFLCSKYFIIDWKVVVIGLISAVAIFILAKNKCEKYYDVSWDGQAYHLEAIVKMIEGWNPIQQYLDNSVKAENIYINHYPRGTWFSALSLYMFSGEIESVKTFNYLWMVIAWFLSVVVLNQFFKINFFLALIIGLVAATNPVSIYQSQSNYIDGQIAAGILVFILLAIFIFFSQQNGAIILLAVAIAVLVNYKFSMPFYFIVLLMGIGLIFWQYKNLPAIRRLFIASVIGFGFGIMVLGFSPYMSNLINYHNPIYPLADETKKEISKGIENAIAPVSFPEMNRFERLFQSTFSKSIWSQTPLNNVLKIPGTFGSDEIMNYAVADGSMAGLGPYFSLAISICLLLIPLFYFFDRKIFYSLIIAITIIFLSVFITRIGWLARYAPQLYLICVMVVVAFFLLKKKWSYFMGSICLLLLLKNDYTISEIYYFHQKVFTRELNTRLNELAQRDDTVKVFFTPFNSNRIRFKEKEIKFKKVKSIEELKTDSPKYIPWLFNRAATD